MFRPTGSILSNCVCVCFPFCLFCYCLLIKCLSRAFLGSQMTTILKRGYPGVVKALLQIGHFITLSEIAKSFFIQPRLAPGPLDSPEVMTNIQSWGTELHYARGASWLSRLSSVSEGGCSRS